jgi:urease accessory protein
MRSSDAGATAGAAVLALLLADSRTPSGGYAHSAGLEAAVEAGLPAASVPDFAAARLETVGFVDAAFAAAACRASMLDDFGSLSDRRTSSIGVDALLALDDELAARTPSAPLRTASRQLGRALLRLGAALWPGDAALGAYAAASETTPRPVALGVLARAAGLDPLATARLSLYEDAAGVAAAAVKLLPLDAATTTAWVARLAARIEQLAARAASAGELPATATPLLDLRSINHDRSERRLFVT